MNLLKKGIKLGENRKFDFFIKAFLDPKPKVKLGERLKAKDIASSMIDISDGLSVDLFNLCEASNVGAVIYQNKLPVSNHLLSEKIKEKYNFVLHGGEDYELLFTVPAFKFKEINDFKEKVTLIGYITERDKGIKIIDFKGKETFLEKKGYEHFIW